MLGPWSPHSHATDVELRGGPKGLPQPGHTVEEWPMAEGKERPLLCQRITVAVDGSRPSLKAFEFALALARNFRASMALVTVVPTPPPYGTPFFPEETWKAICQAYADELTKLERRARRQGLSRVTAECRQGIAVDQILEYLGQHPTDLLVVGARGLSASRREVLGSVSDALVHDAPCPVLVVREYVKPET